MAEIPPAAFALGATIEQMLGDAGPLTEAQIAERLETAGELPGPDARFTLARVLDEATEWVMPLPDGRWASLLTLLRDRVFTHRLTEIELAHDVVRVDGDLSPVTALLSGDDARLADGTRLREVVLPSDASLLAERAAPEDAFGAIALLLEPGRLRALGLAAGGVLGLRLGARGLELMALDEDPAPAADLPRVLACVLPAGSEPELYDSVIFTALVDDPELLRTPAAPLGEALTELGYARDGEWLAPPGFDFAAWRAAQAVESLLDRYELDADEAMAVAVVLDLYEQIAELFDAASEAERTGDEERKAKLLAELDVVAAGADSTSSGVGATTIDESDVRDALDLLGEPTVASTVLAEAEVWRPDGAASLGLFADTLGALAPRSARPALRWLQAKAYERLGAVAEAEQTYLAAQDLDASWPLTLYELARYAADRGDVERALGLLRRAGAPADDHLVELLERFRPEPRHDLGRNDRCWCGSGRKYKQCHLHREQLPLEERADWLYEKACIALHTSQARELLISVAAESVRLDDSEDALLEALDDPFTTDVTLFEGRVFLDFLASRGQLLPEDERSLAEQWLRVGRSVHEVLEVRDGGFTARDLRTGEVHDVRATIDGGEPEAGAVICARIVPVGETMRVFGGARPVPAHRRDELLALLDSDVNPFDLVAFFARA